MEYIVICFSALLASSLTFFSGFGLGTILTPILAVFFPIQIAISVTALVHLSNNLFKLFLVGNHANKKVTVQFAIPAVIAAVFGASLLSYVSMFPVIGSYFVGGSLKEITVIKMVIGSIIIIFSCLELLPNFEKFAVTQKYISIGGALSGFFGGLSGNQGALRSMFLMKAGLSKESFVATSVVLAVLIDLARLFVYGIGFYRVSVSQVLENWGLILAATISAFIGSLLGRELLKRITLRAVQISVAIMLVILGIALIFGLV